MGRLAAIVDNVRMALGVPRHITLELEPLHTFDTAPQPVDKLLSAMRAGVGPVSREYAMSVSAVQRGRNELCAIATIPIRLFQGTDVVPSALLRQYDVDVPNVVHMSLTVEDLVFDGLAWWQVTGTDFDGFPVSVRRIAPSRVQTKRPNGPAQPGDDRFVWVRSLDDKSWDQVPATLMKRFDSPNPAVLKANSLDIKLARKLQGLTAMYADNPALREYFTDADGDEDGMADPDIDAFLAEYRAMRQVSPVGWIPSTVKRVDGGGGPSPKDLTLADLQQQAMIALANALGVDPEDIGVSTTSRTYQNADDRRRDKINRVYGPYMSAITDRLSMGDITRRGYTTGFDLTNYLKSDPAARTAYYQAMKDLIGLKPEWIAQQEGIPMSAIGPTPAAPAEPPVPAQNALPAGQRFAAGGPSFVFNTADFAGSAPAPTVDTAARTITGLAVPYNAVANKYGLKYSFKPGSLEYSDPARMAHLKDHATPVGFHRKVTDSSAGPVVELAVLDGPDGSPAKAERDQLLYDAANGLYSGLSVGVDFSIDPEDGDVEYDPETGVYNVLRATWRETSTTYMPAFDDARVTKVAASRTGGQMDPCQHCGQRHAPNIACATFAAQLRNQPALPAAPAAVPAAVPQMTPEQWAAFSAFMQPAAPAAPAVPEQPTVVNPAGTVQVAEPLPYRYDRKGNLKQGTHDFSADLLLAYSPAGTSDPAAGNRIAAWLEYALGDDPHPGRLDRPAAAEQFAITPANVVNLNYPQNKPDMYVDQLDYLYPLVDATNKGTLDTVTPFVVPKFNSSSGLVADHVTGTEPTPGAFTATAQTITPSALSGKVEITREAFDQGGNPQMSALIWRQMVRAWYEGLEAAVQAFLVANAASIPDIALGVAVTDAAMDQAIAAAISALQYIRGGDRFSKVFTQIDLYQKLIKAVDTTGRPLYPTYGAMNASGTVDPAQNYLNVRGKTFVPSWATAASGTVAASSWMFDPDVVCLWASTPQRIDLQWRVAWVDMGIWGYKALAVTDFSRTRELIYDPV